MTTFASLLPLLAARLRAARAAVGAHATCHVTVVAGSDKPRLCGESYHWTTRTGRRVRHPSAYAKVGWSSLCYVASDLHVTVGDEWLATHALA